MSQFHQLLSDATDFAIEEFGRDEKGRRLYLVIAGRRVPIMQNNLPIQAADSSVGYIDYGSGEVICRKSDVLAATGGKLPESESLVTLIVEGATAGNRFQVSKVDTSHGDPGLSLQLKVAE